MTGTHLGDEHGLVTARRAATEFADESAPIDVPRAVDEVVVLDYGGQYSQLIARRVRELRGLLRAAPAPRGRRRRSPGASRRASSSPAVRPRCTPPARRSSTASCSSSASRCWASATACSCSRSTSAARSKAPRWASSGARSSPSTARRRCSQGPARPSSPAGCRTATPSTRRPPGFTALASSTQSPVAAVESVERGIYGIQFHPEVVHTPYGQRRSSRASCATSAAAT